MNWLWVAGMAGGVAAWESGVRVPQVDVLERLAQVCGKRLHISIDVD